MAVPLTCVVCISMIKDAYEDYKRHRHDRKENRENEAERFDAANGGFEKVEWQDIRVGNIVKVYRDEAIPADMILLNSQDQKGACYVETKNLDGETNLKVKYT